MRPFSVIQSRYKHFCTIILVGLLIFGLVPTALIIYQQLQVDEGTVSSLGFYSKDSLRAINVPTLWFTTSNFQVAAKPLFDLNKARNATMK